jgi:hypothetical protein
MSPIGVAKRKESKGQNEMIYRGGSSDSEGSNHDNEDEEIMIKTSPESLYQIYGASVKRKVRGKSINQPYASISPAKGMI